MLKLSPVPIFFHRVLQKCAKNLASLSDLMEETHITIFFYGIATFFYYLLLWYLLYIEETHLQQVCYIFFFFFENKVICYIELEANSLSSNTLYF